MLLVGKIVAADTFDPVSAILVQNRDDLRIPLDLETVPTPKEFKDAIESLSPEQQQFAKAFRAMQLSSTLFGLCVLPALATRSVPKELETSSRNGSTNSAFASVKAHLSISETNAEIPLSSRKTCRSPVQVT